jgi:plasmid maintenance system killer protein
MIVSFKHRGLKRLHERNDSRQIRADLINKVENILAVLEAADTPQALDLPGFRLHPLKKVTVGGSGLSRFAPTGGSYFALRMATLLTLS